MKTTIEFDADLAYFKRKLDSAREIDRAKIKRQIKLMEDAIVIHHEHRPSAIAEMMRFGFTEEESISLMNKYRYTHAIPKSFLVQTFMRKIQDGMDRRRP